VEPDSIAHGNHRLGALIVVKEVMNGRAGAAVDDLRLGGVNQAEGAAGLIKGEAVGVFGIRKAEV